MDCLVERILCLESIRQQVLRVIRDIGTKYRLDLIMARRFCI